MNGKNSNSSTALASTECDGYTADTFTNIEMLRNITHRPIYGVVYGEYGYRIIGDIPPPDKLEKIKIESEKYMAECKKERDKLQQREFEYYESLWEIDHPFQSGWRKFKKWLKAV